MMKRSSFGPIYLIALGVLFLGASGCSPLNVRPSSSSSVAVSPQPISTTAPAASPSPEVPSPQAQEAAYKQGLAKAKSAEKISQSALTEDDWQLVVSRWQQAVDLLKTLPSSSPYAALAKTKLAEFEKRLSAANQKVAQAKAKREQSGDLSSLANSEPLKVTSAIAPAPNSGQIFRAPIKRRAGGTPIIDVVFNGAQTFEMIVDTGASGTVITGAMAEALGVRIIGKTKVNTASQAGVEVPLAYVKSIAVGQAVVKDVIVAVGNEALDIGLLGHDFFSDFDVTVKQDVVEFRKR